MIKFSDQKGPEDYLNRCFLAESKLTVFQNMAIQFHINAHLNI